MDYFDTLKNKPLRELFQILAVDRFGKTGKSWSQIRNEITFLEKVEIFGLAHKCLKALGYENNDPTIYLDPDNFIDETADA